MKLFLLCIVFKQTLFNKINSSNLIIIIKIKIHKIKSKKKLFNINRLKIINPFSLNKKTNRLNFLMIKAISVIQIEN